MHKTVTLMFSLFILSAVATAQIPTGGNVFFGYSYSRALLVSPSDSARIGANGWEGSLEGKFLPWIGIVADIDWHYGGHLLTNCLGTGCTGALVHVNASRHDILFGPRASVSIGKFTPFAELLLGVAHQTDSGGAVSNSDTAFATAVGGGLDYKLIKGVAWRLQGDSIHESLFGHGENDFRLSTGIVFRF